MQDKEVLLSLRNVDISFGKGKIKAVNDANFHIYKGETFSLVGESGSGKTTIGRAIIRVNPCSAGEIVYRGKRISGKISKKLERQVIREIQMVFQDPSASLNERSTVDYIVSEGLYNFHLYENETDICGVACAVCCSEFYSGCCFRGRNHRQRHLRRKSHLDPGQ